MSRQPTTAYQASRATSAARSARPAMCKAPRGEPGANAAYRPQGQEEGRGEREHDEAEHDQDHPDPAPGRPHAEVAGGLADRRIARLDERPHDRHQELAD